MQALRQCACFEGHMWMQLLWSVFLIGGGLLVNEQHYCLGFIYRVGLNLPVYVIGIYENCGTFPGFPSDDSDGFLKPSTFAKYTGRDEVCDDFQQPSLESGFTNSWWPSEQTFEGFVSDHSLRAIFFKQSINLWISNCIYAEKYKENHPQVMI